MPSTEKTRISEFYTLSTKWKEALFTFELATDVTDDVTPQINNSDSKLKQLEQLDDPY